MLCSSTSHEHSPILARYQPGPLPGAGYLIHPAYADGLQHDYSTFAVPDAGPAHGQAAVLNYVQDQCSIHSSAPPANPAGLAFPPNLPAPDSRKKFWEPAGLTSSGSSNRAANNAPDSVLAGQPKSTQQAQRQNGRAFYRGGSSTTTTGAKKRKRVATVAQRRAANIRERRRMFNLNEAFDKLRRKVPTFAYEKRLSRIETLRLAITYISFMDQVIRSEVPPPAAKSAATMTASLGEAAAAVTSLPDADQRRQQIDAHFREASAAAPICW